MKWQCNLWLPKISTWEQQLSKPGWVSSFCLDPTRSTHFMSSISSTCHCTAAQHIFFHLALWRCDCCKDGDSVVPVMPSLASFLGHRGIGEQHCIIIAKAIAISSIQADLKSVIQEKIQLDSQLTLCLHLHNVFISRFHEYRIVQDRWAGSFDFVPSLALPCLQGVPAHSSKTWLGT